MENTKEVVGKTQKRTKGKHRKGRRKSTEQDDGKAQRRVKGKHRRA